MGTLPEGDAAADEAARRPGSRRRRRAVFKALHDSVIEKGYNRTTLSDIAARAGMSPSHLLYYFRSKDDVLEQYFDGVSERLLQQLEDMRRLPPRERVELLGDIWFRGAAAAPTEIGFMLECFGAAVHDDTLRETKAAFDKRCKAHLVDIFRTESGGMLASSEDAAEVAYSMMIGLRSAVYFDALLDLEDSRRIFCDTVLKIAGLAAEPER